MSINKILIIRLSSIGDIVLTTPVPRCIKSALPNAQVHFATRKSNAGILIHNPHVDQVHILGDSFSAFMAELKAEDFDYIVDLHNSILSRRIRHALRKPYSGFRKLNIRKFLLVSFKIQMRGAHIVQRYIETAKKIGVQDDGKGLEYPIHPSEEVDLKTLPEAFQSGYVGLSVGAQHATKCLPLPKMIELCGLIQAPIVLLGGPEDKETASEVLRALPQATLWNACGNYTLNQSVSLVRQAKLMIAHDTGLMHIAAALHKNVLSVWGNTVPELGMTPYKAGSESKIFEVKQLSCRPCSKIGSARCPKKHFGCMQQQNCHAIAAYANKLFASLPCE